MRWRLCRVAVNLRALAWYTGPRPGCHIPIHILPNVLGRDEVAGGTDTRVCRIMQRVEDGSAIRWWQVRSRCAGREVTDKRLRSTGERDFTPLQGARG